MRWAAALWLSILAAPAAGQVSAAADEKPLGDYKLRDFAAKVMMQHDDLAEVERYRNANRALAASLSPHPRIVMIGASITFHWTDDRLPRAPRHQIVNRGIPGQNSSQMLLRFEDDVIALRPAAVVIMEMTNDLRVYVGDPAEPAARTALLDRMKRNIRAMADIAKANDVKVALATIPPIGPDHERLQRDPATLREANAWIRTFAASRNYPVLDLHGILAGADGFLPPAFAPDGLHPTSEGYRLIAPAFERVLSLLRLERKRN